MPPVQVMDVPMQSNQGVPGMPMVQQVQVTPAKKKDAAGLIKTIVIIIVSLIAVTFIGLFIWMYTQYDKASTDVEGQIATAKAEAREEQALKDEAEFLEREKNPYKIFSGPADYGELNFEYPKTWSAYVAKDASNGGDFEAYFNPTQIEPISNTSVNSLRVQIFDKDFESITSQYQRYLENKEKPLSVETIKIGEDGSTPANLYTGIIPNTELNGYILIFKIRDKTALLRTDSTLFKEDFDKLVETIKFNA